MPPKIKVSKEDIIKTALEMVRAKGPEALNARSIAVELNCSTQPIFSNFANMTELQAATKTYAYNIYLNFIKEEVESESYPAYKAFGMAYIRFAKEEKELFKLLFMCDRSDDELTPTSDFEASVEMIMNANRISRETASLMHLEMWTFVHGIGTMLATSFLELDRELISNMITDVYQGIRLRHIKGATNDGNKN